MTLYRIDESKSDELGKSWVGSLVFMQTIFAAIKNGVLVEVEPCVHGNYAGHIKPTAEWAGVGPSGADWCPGAGIGES